MYWADHSFHGGILRSRLLVDFAGNGPRLPDVPFCAAGKVATAVVLARCSVLEVWSTAPTTLASERGSPIPYSRGRRPPCLLLSRRPERNLGGICRHYFGIRESESVAMCRRGMSPERT
jgi:hypothetical protein